MSKQIEALKLALECIEAWDRGCDRDHYWRDIEAATNAIREALAEQPAQQQEPVGSARCPRCWEPITPPASKPWVNATTWRGLTDEEIEQACVPLGAAMLSFTEVARAVEAKLRELNEHREKNA